jgi:hypothetical protein
MSVTIKKIHHELEIKNNGIEFSIRGSRGRHLGDLYVQKSGIVWCSGKTSRERGESVSWEKLIRWIERRD